MRRLATYRLAVLLAGVLLLVGGACWTRRPPVDGGVRGLSANTAIDSVELQSGVDTVIVARKTPPLPRRIEHMSNDDLDVYLRSLGWKTGGYNKHSTNAACTHRSTGQPCTGTDSAHVVIQPEAGMNKRKYAEIPDSGVIVARIINDAPLDLDEAYFGYPAQDTTYWVVDRSAPDTLQSRFFIRTHSNPAVHFVTHSWPFKDCGHIALNLQARAKFWSCVESETHRLEVSVRDSQDGAPRVGTLESYIHPVSLRSAMPLPSAAAPAPEPFALRSNWVSCGSGCCATM